MGDRSAGPGGDYWIFQNVSVCPFSNGCIGGSASGNGYRHCGLQSSGKIKAGEAEGGRLRAAYENRNTYGKKHLLFSCIWYTLIPQLYQSCKIKYMQSRFACVKCLLNRELSAGRKERTAFPEMERRSRILRYAGRIPLQFERLSPIVVE